MTETVTLILSHLPITQPKKKNTLSSSTSPSQEEDLSTSSQPQDTTTPSSEETPYIDFPNTYNNTALHWACLGGHLDVVKLLLSRGACPTVANDKDQIPLDLAAFNNHMHVVEYFLAQSRDLEGDNAQAGGLEGGVGSVEMSVEDSAEEQKGEGKA